MTFAVRPHRPRLAALALAVLIALTGLAAIAARASASDKQISIMMDDDQLLYRSDAARDTALDTMRRLGVDWVRVTVLWSVVAQDAHTKKYRKKFDPDVPKTYPRHNWDRYDRLVNAASKYGINVYMNVTGPGPSWAMKRTKVKKARKSYKPKPQQFYHFVKAVATRYSGTYRDENGGKFVLPRVRFYSLWNEPNQGGWLSPQWEENKALGKPVAASPILYRELYLYGYKALGDAGALKPDTTVLIGETAPLGTDRQDITSAMRPGQFIRELFCLDPAGNPYAGAEAAARKCSAWDRFGGTFKATAWAHHPYTKKLPPLVKDGNPDSFTMANISDMGTLLDSAAAKTHRIASGMPLIMTEYGYETNPPDPYSGVPLDKQAEYINVGDFLAWNNPRILGQTQFLLRDVPRVKGKKKTSKAAYFTYQSGLFFSNGRPKPAALAYLLPFVAYPTPGGGGTVNVWGQLRFLPNSATKTQVAHIQFRVQGGTTWQTVADMGVTQGFGFFSGTITAPGPGVWRAAYGDPARPSTVSREVIIG